MGAPCATPQVAEKNRIRQHNKELDDLYNNQMNQLDEHCCAVQKVLSPFPEGACGRAGWGEGWLGSA